MNRLAAAAGVGLLALATGSAMADVRVNTFVFENDDGAPTGGLDIWIEAIDLGSEIELVWHNDSTISANVTDIYIEGNAISESALGDATIFNTADVQYSEGTTPLNPAGSIQFFGGPWKGTVFGADPDTPRPQVNAINPGESLAIRFTLEGGATFDDVLASLNAGEDGFRMAAHVQGLDPNDASLWVVTPAPGAVAPLAIAGLGLARRRRRA